MLDGRTIELTRLEAEVLGYLQRRAGMRAAPAGPAQVNCGIEGSGSGGNVDQGGLPSGVVDETGR